MAGKKVNGQFFPEPVTEKVTKNSFKNVIQTVKSKESVDILWKTGNERRKTGK